MNKIEKIKVAKAISYRSSITLIYMYFIYKTYGLFISGRLPSSEAVLLFISLSVLALTAYFIDRVEGVSIGGNTLKLRDITQKAEDALANLIEVQKSTYKLLISNSFYASGSHDSTSIVDPRCQTLYELYSSLKNSDFFEDLKPELHKFSRFVLYQQSHAINRNAKITIRMLDQDPMTPEEVKEEAFNDEKFTSIILRRHKSDPMTIETCRRNTVVSTKNYDKVYEIYEKTKPNHI